MSGVPSLRTAILGSGIAATDLAVKIRKSSSLSCFMMAGQNALSKGLKRAKELGIRTSSFGIDAIKEASDNIDLVFDFSSSIDHHSHAETLAALDIKCIDLTPAQIGKACVPCINSQALNMYPCINMVSYTGQAAIPIIDVCAQVFGRLKNVKVDTFLASDAVGATTIDYIDEYYSTTINAIEQLCDVEKVEVDLTVEPSTWQPDMLNRIEIEVEDSSLLDEFYVSLMHRMIEIRSYMPGFLIVGTPTIKKQTLEILVSVRGHGDWLPPHAGNLEIMNSASLFCAEQLALFQMMRA